MNAGLLQEQQLAAGLASCPVAELESMLAAGHEIIECYRVLKKADLNIVGECLKDQGTFYEFDHYPKGDVYDNETHSQYYYHAHRSEAGEHGHFHTFLRAEGMPDGIRCADYAGDVEWPAGDEALSHLVGISMDRYGFPTDLFTTNRWVTGETWYHCADVIRMLDVFEMDHAYPSWPVNRWMTAMIRLFRPTVEALLRERDAALESWRRKHPDADVYEDRELELTCMTPISVERQIAAIKAVLK